eukprot:CFRG5773T1
MSFFESALRLESDEMRKLQKEYASVVSTSASLETQLMENEIVKQELNLVKDDNNDKVFKLVGPVLVSQDLNEAKDNVAKRIEFISKEVERQNTLTKELVDKMSEKREKIQQMQVQAQKSANAAVAPGQS